MWIEEYSYDEFKKRVEDWWEGLSEDHRHEITIRNDVSFDEWVLGQLKPGDKVVVDWDNYDFHIINPDIK